MNTDDSEFRYKSDDHWEEAMRYLNEKDYDKAIALLDEFLEEEPDDHVILTALGACYYQKRDYETALEHQLKALEYSPHCPLVQWNYAEALSIMDRNVEALAVYKNLIRRGERGVGLGRCHQGIGWARTVLNDCRFKVGRIYLWLGKKKLSRRWLEEHLRHRRRGLRSVFTLKEVRSEIYKLDC